MKFRIESEMVTIEEVVSNSRSWSPNMQHNGNSGFQTLNARAVEFIAKPGQVRELKNCIRDKVMAHLKRSYGFSSAVVLTSHKEPRHVLVLSFWETESQAANSRWEHAAEVRKTVLPLIDVCSKVETYEAAVATAAGSMLRRVESEAC